MPTGAALASADSQGEMDALEELMLLKDQVCTPFRCTFHSLTILFQVRDVSRVCHLTQKIAVPVQGDLMVHLKKVRFVFWLVNQEDGLANRSHPQVINTMVDNLEKFATEGMRVSRDVGTEVCSFFLPSAPTVPSLLPLMPRTPANSLQGKHGAQAHVGDVEGTWRELTDEVNTFTANLTTQVRFCFLPLCVIFSGERRRYGASRW